MEFLKLYRYKYFYINYYITEMYWPYSYANYQYLINQNQLLHQQYNLNQNSSLLWQNMGF